MDERVVRVRYRPTLLEQSSHRRLVAVDDGIYTIAFTLSHSMSKLYSAINFHDHVFIWNYHLVWLNWRL